MSQQPNTKCLLDLPQDVLDLIVSHLDPQTISNLRQTGKRANSVISSSPTIQSHIFEQYFNDSVTSYTWNHTHPNWRDLMALRKSAKLLTWGALGGGRLGYTASYIHSSGQDSHLSRQRFNQGVCRPTEVFGFDFPVKVVKAGGFSFQILLSNGDIYSTGQSWHYGNTAGIGPSGGDDHNELVELAREQERRQREEFLRAHSQSGRGINIPSFNSSPYVIPNERESEESGNNRDVKQVKVLGGEKVRFTDISSGRSQFVALSEDYKVYGFDTNEVGIRLQFKGIENRVKKVRSGWNFNAVEFYGLGLGFWKQRQPLGRDSEYSEVEPKMITREEVVDFVLLENHVVYIDSKNSVWTYDIGMDIRVEMIGFNKKFNELNEKNMEPRPIKLSGFFRTFVVFSNIDVCLFNNLTEPDEIVSFPELNSAGCVDIQIADYHQLALLASGKVLTWGVQKNNCGSLGLGGDVEEIRSQGAIVEGSTTILTKPTLIDSITNCVGIACGGWHSCVIVNPDQQ